MVVCPRRHDRTIADSTGDDPLVNIDVRPATTDDAAAIAPLLAELGCPMDVAQRAGAAEARSIVCGRGVGGGVHGDDGDQSALQSPENRTPCDRPRAVQCTVGSHGQQAVDDLDEVIATHVRGLEDVAGLALES